MGLDGFDLILVQEAQSRLDFYYGSFWLRIIVLGGQLSHKHHFGVAKMKLIVPKGGIEKASLRGSKPVYSA